MVGNDWGDAGVHPDQSSEQGILYSRAVLWGSGDERFVVDERAMTDNQQAFVLGKEIIRAAMNDWYHNNHAKWLEMKPLFDEMCELERKYG